MQNTLTTYPAVPWKPNWRFSFGPDDNSPMFTGIGPGEIIPPTNQWILRLTDPDLPFSVRLFSNGLFIRGRKQRLEHTITAFYAAPGILTGSVHGFPAPTLHAKEIEEDHAGAVWAHNGHHTALLLCKDSRFAFISGEFPQKLALLKAEETLDTDFKEILRKETELRRPVIQMFSINPRHNPPIALAAESLRQRLRGRTPALPGIWSASAGFKNETFSLNELYPLIRTWMQIDPDIALELMRTTLSLQQSSGGFPAWVDSEGSFSSAAPWPFIIQSFEHVWQQREDSALLMQKLPFLRKYMHWALRHFDPHHDQIPSWQSEQESFIPDNFERDKATPDITTMLICELNTLIRLSKKSLRDEPTIEQLETERNKLSITLRNIFWNSNTRTFSNVWKNGHYIHEPTFGSLLPLIMLNIDSTQMLAFETNLNAITQTTSSEQWNQEKLKTDIHQLAIQQFLVTDSLRHTTIEERSLLVMFIQRVRERYSDWFERQSIRAARNKPQDEPDEPSAYFLEPVEAALVLTAQHMLQERMANRVPVLKHIERFFFRRLRLDMTDLRIFLLIGVAIIIVHLLYNIAAPVSESTRMSEAALDYKQGNLTDALQICRQYPDNPLSCFLRANLLMITDDPTTAEKLYLKTLHAETESPSALFGYALALQMNGNFDLAIRRYNDFIDIYEARLSRDGQEDLVDLAYEFLRLAEEKFKKPPKWKRAYRLPEMNDLGL